MAVNLNKYNKVGKRGYNDSGLFNLLGLKLNVVTIIILQHQENKYRDKVYDGIKYAIGLAQHVKAEDDKQYY
jgi:hypothetical protein